MALPLSVCRKRDGSGTPRGPREGCNVFVAARGSEGQALAERIQPAVVVLDLMLPDISGEELCANVRGRSGVPILMLTAKASEEERIAGLVAGADDCLVKRRSALATSSYGSGPYGAGRRPSRVTLARYPERATGSLQDDPFRAWASEPGV